MNRIAILAACIAFPIMAQTMAIQPSTPSPATETKTFVLKDGGKLKVSNVNGYIKISAWDRDEVALTANFKPSSDDKHVRLEVESQNDSLELIAKYPEKNKSKRFNNRGASLEMELNVPRHIVGKISTVNGGISLKSLGGQINASTVNGGITLENTEGRINISTVNGGISGSINNANHLDMDTVNGGIKVKLNNPNGSLKASSVNGGIKLNTPGASEVNARKHSVKARFGNGNSSMDFSTVNGSIVID
jgi:DUF4097 and DUF4098 domain-containing protein YvlB